MGLSACKLHKAPSGRGLPRKRVGEPAVVKVRTQIRLFTNLKLCINKSSYKLLFARRAPFVSKSK